jgi:hypothetical protein
MAKPRLYPHWRTNTEKRWRDAFHTFGHLLLTHARDKALKGMPQSASGECKAIAAKVATDVLYNVMMILEGVVGAKADADHSLEFALVARVRDKSRSDAISEEFELAPNGAESVCMGFHFWTGGDFTV